MKKSSKLSNINYQVSKKPLLFIVGPTASGKTSAAIEAALAIGGEIICADSQTVRRDLNIGTAKPSALETSLVKHHLINMVGPYDEYNVAQFKSDAQAAIKEIRGRGMIPIVVGGTGLYINSLFYDYDLSKTDDTDRSKLESLSVVELRKIITNNKYEMPENKENPRHLIGVIARKGQNPDNNEPIEGAKIYGIRRSDEELKLRISERVDKMFNEGFVNEVQNLIKNYGRPPKKMDAIGYPIAQKYLDGELTIDEAKEVFKRADWQYARRQKAWFKRNRFIQWFPDEKQAAESIIKDIESS